MKDYIMPRSNVLRGVHKQLNRAQLRSRLDKKQPVNNTDSLNDLLSWFENNIVTSDPAKIESINVKNFLYATSNIRLVSEERLRNLAIFLEENVCKEMRTWLAIDRIYCAATNINANDIRLHHSRALTAHLFHEILDNSKNKKRIQEVAFNAIDSALAIDETDVESLYLKGTLYYFSNEHSKNKALKCHDQALSIDPQHAWSLLYRAHCLHDLQNWHEAAEAYSKIKASFFCGNQAWRYEIFLEQKAYCCFKAGQKNKALREFSCLIDRWKKDENLCKEAYGMYLAEIAERDQKFLTNDIIQFIEQQGWIKLYKSRSNK